MVRGPGIGSAAAPSAAAPEAVTGSFPVDREDRWRSFDNSVNSVSFGFVATAILISLFLVMAIFEGFLRPRSLNAAGTRNPDGDEANLRKPDYPSPKMTVYPKGVSVLMPGEQIPTFLAHPVPTPYTPDSHV